MLCRQFVEEALPSVFDFDFSGQITKFLHFALVLYDFRLHKNVREYFLLLLLPWLGQDFLVERSPLSFQNLVLFLGLLRSHNLRELVEKLILLLLLLSLWFEILSLLCRLELGLNWLKLLGRHELDLSCSLGHHFFYVRFEGFLVPDAKLGLLCFLNTAQNFAIA